ncbi:hypothetical protein IAT38_003288 [Cryptococcus sp. DSM 104549]
MNDPLTHPDPPSYDSSLAAPAGGGSSSQTQSDIGSSSAGTSVPAAPRADIRHLFSKAPGAVALQNLDSGARAQAGLVQWYEQLASSGGYWSDDMIISTDSALSTASGLYEFLQYMALETPTLTIRCHGYQKVAYGGPPSIHDFNFKIDLDMRAIFGSPHQYILSSQAPWTPCCRGTEGPVYGASLIPKPSLAVRASRGYEQIESGLGDEVPPTEAGRPWGQDRQEWEAWETWRRWHGVPSWVKMKDSPEFIKERKSVAGRQEGKRLDAICAMQERARDDAKLASVYDWCEDYCASPGPFKEFWVAQNMVGWDFEELRNAISTAIRAAGHKDGLDITFEKGPTMIRVKSSNFFSRALDWWIIAILAWPTLIYPLIIFLRKFFPYWVGGYWETVRITYPLKLFPALPATFPSETIASARERLHSLRKEYPELPAPDVIRLEQGPEGVHYMVGKTEGDWFKEWEDKIKKAVEDKYEGTLKEGDAREDGRPGLYGYEQNV